MNEEEEEEDYEEDDEEVDEEVDEDDAEDPAAEVGTKLGPGGPVENIFWAILPTIVTAFPKVPFLRSNLYRLPVTLCSAHLCVSERSFLDCQHLEEQVLIFCGGGGQ